MSVKEFETTINIKTSKSLYDQAIPILKDVIIFFNTNNRISERKYQLKTQNDKPKHILRIFNNIKYPLVRSESVETLQNLKNGSKSQIEYAKTIISRKIVDYGKIQYINGTLFDINYREYKNKVDVFGEVKHVCQYRLSFNHHINEHGDKYIFSSEIEYNDDIDYDDLCSIETLLIQKIENYKLIIEFSDLSKTDMFVAAAPKIQMFSGADLNKDYQWAFKWNGVKAKFTYFKNTIFLWKDMHDLETIKTDDKQLKLLDQFCIQVEVLDDKIVIVEIIAAKYNDTLYYIEPKTNLNMLYELYNLFKQKDIFIDGKRLIIQQFYQKPLPQTYDSINHDGFLIHQNNKLIKWKFPTIDIQYIKPGHFIFDDNTIITNVIIPNNFEFKKKKIYEVCFDFNQRKLKILRERIDRITPSNKDEVLVFKNCIQYLNKIL